MSWFIPHDVNESSYGLYAQDFPELDIQLQAPTVEFVDGEPAYVILDSPIQACPRLSPRSLIPRRLVSRACPRLSPRLVPSGAGPRSLIGDLSPRLVPSGAGPRSLIGDLSPRPLIGERLVSRNFGDRSPEFKFNSSKLRLEHCPHCGEPQVVRMGDKDSEDTVCLACGETTLEELR